MDAKNEETVPIEAVNSPSPTQTEPPDNDSFGTISSPPPCGLPTEVWAHIFSFLSDFHLLRSVIPVNRLFRSLAYYVGFQNLSNLGGYWWIYDFSPSFLRAIPCFKKLHISFGDEVMCPDDLDLPQHCLKLLEMIHSGVESLSIDIFPPPLSKIETLRFPNLKELTIIGEWLCDETANALGRFVNAIARQLKVLRIDFELPNSKVLFKALENDSRLTSLTMHCSGTFSRTFSPALRFLVSLHLRTGEADYDPASVSCDWLFKNCPHLEELEVHALKVRIDDADFRAPKLKSLSLISCEFTATSADVGRKAVLRHFPNLTHLTVGLDIFPIIAGQHPALSNLLGLTVSLRCNPEKECSRSLERSLALCQKMEELSIFGDDETMEFSRNIEEYALRCAPHELLPSSANLKSYAFLGPPSWRKRYTIESFSTQWHNLQVLKLGFVEISLLTEICTQYSGLKELSAGVDSFKEFSQLLSYLGQTRSNIERLTLRSWPVGEVAEYVEKGYFLRALDAIRRLVSSCYSVLPQSDEAILSKYPMLKEFSFTTPPLTDDEFFYRYTVMKTCIGQVKRLIVWGCDDVGTYDRNCHIIPSSHWLQHGDKLPEALCNDMHYLEFLSSVYRGENEEIETSDDNDKRKIFVGETGRADECDLALYFKDFGPIKALKLCHEKYRRQRYAFVVFQNESAVDKVISKDSHTLRNGTTVKVQKFERKPRGGSGSGCDLGFDGDRCVGNSGRYSDRRDRYTSRRDGNSGRRDGYSGRGDRNCRRGTGSQDRYTSRQDRNTGRLNGCNGRSEESRGRHDGYTSRWDGYTSRRHGHIDHESRDGQRYGGRWDGHSDSPDGYSGRRDGYTNRRDGYSGRHEGFSGRCGGFSGRCEEYSGRRDGYVGRRDENSRRRDGDTSSRDSNSSRHDRNRGRHDGDSGRRDGNSGSDRDSDRHSGRYGGGSGRR